MADDTPSINPAAEFQALPLDFIVSAPLTAAVKAQQEAAKATREFIQSMIKDGKPITVDFELAYNDQSGTGKTATIQAPLLSLVPVPHLRIDELTVDFTYEISQTLTSKQTNSKMAQLEVSSGTMLSPWVSASFKGSVSNKSSRSNSMNRSGELDIHVKASESQMPEGLSRVLSLLARSVDVGEGKPQDN